MRYAGKGGNSWCHGADGDLDPVLGRGKDDIAELAYTLWYLDWFHFNLQALQALRDEFRSFGNSNTGRLVSQSRNRHTFHRRRGERNFFHVGHRSTWGGGGSDLITELLHDLFCQHHIRIGCIGKIVTCLDELRAGHSLLHEKLLKCLDFPFCSSKGIVRLNPAGEGGDTLFFFCGDDQHFPIPMQGETGNWCSDGKISISHIVGIESSFTTYQIEIGIVSYQVSGNQQRIFEHIDGAPGGHEKNWCIRIVDDPTFCNILCLFTGSFESVSLTVIHV